MMQAVHKGNHPDISSAFFLPMVDMKPSDMTSQYSTLFFVTKGAFIHDSTPVLTFDQRIWWKAKMIVTSEPEDSRMRSMVLRLGPFYVEISFLGYIGRLLVSNGYREMLEITYAFTLSCILSKERQCLGN
ncbi:TGF beta-inducible nuclear protein [Elysia marginata]|uniref:TGF beta-inducible nuclear protein n=1 Tax=Elysia marginata TaxID=1093978 RepID=A0AAV4HMJ9_9GAST|nr:TGF beta-inducible nuclear protein [Elysia marginata]